jgi:hypothetical protein
MWIFNFLPTWIAQVIALLGVLGLVVSFFAGFFARFYAPILTLKLPIQIISIVVLSFGFYLTGWFANQDEWLAKVKEMEAKVQVAEQKAKEVNTKIEYKYRDRVKVVKEVQVVIQEKIKEVERIIDAKCEVTPEAIEILNVAARNVLPQKSKHLDQDESKLLKSTKGDL